MTSGLKIERTYYKAGAKKPIFPVQNLSVRCKKYLGGVTKNFITQDELKRNKDHKMKKKTRRLWNKAKRCRNFEYQSDPSRT